MAIFSSEPIKAFDIHCFVPKNFKGLFRKSDMIPSMSPAL
jgi:hypothetical protein